MDERKIILVVEDEPILRLAAADLVEASGFESAEAANAHDALEILESGVAIALVFTDIDMPPYMDGTRLAAEIAERWPHVPVVITSGKYNDDSPGVPKDRPFFPKPYREEEILAIFRRLTSG